jgi:hypothetical protein
MLDNQTEPRAIAPLFSVIIPLEFHRGQWERCWRGWQSQTLDKAAFEIILVVPPDFPERDKLSGLTNPAPHLEYSQHSHDVALCADGVTSARGKFLFFTESHCWPEPDVLELCLQAFHANPDWTGCSCKTIRVSHNRMSEVEADMYEADTEYGMIVHPWRKILDVCFVTRREAYEECGGFKPELGHFAEWALAERYFECGHKIGYLPEARIHHYYIGALADLKTFTLDFVAGEIRYFSQNSREPDSTYLEPPAEFICQGNFDRDMARAILRLLVQDIFLSRAAVGRWMQAMFAIPRWASRAIAGDGVARCAAAAAARYAYLATMLATVSGSRQRLGVRFKRYIAALIRYQRLTRIRAERLRNAPAATADAVTESGNNAVLDQTGFYSLEKYHGSPFRWSETAAAVRLRANAGRQSIRIQCAPVRKLSEMDLRFYLDGSRITDDAISIDVDDSEIWIDLPPTRMGQLGWICRRFRAKADPRRLGLPIMHVELASKTSHAVAADADFAVASSMKSV